MQGGRDTRTRAGLADGVGQRHAATGSKGAAPSTRPQAARRTRVLPPLLVFGSERNQDLLLRMHRDGAIAVSRTETFQDLIKAGLAVRFRADDRWKLAVDPRHPARDALRALLAEMSHAPAARARLPRELSPITLDAEHALGHRGNGAFRVLAAVAADGPLDVASLRRRIPDLWPATIARAVGILVRDRLLVLDAEGAPRSRRARRRPCGPSSVSWPPRSRRTTRASPTAPRKRAPASPPSTAPPTARRGCSAPTCASDKRRSASEPGYDRSNPLWLVLEVTEQTGTFAESISAVGAQATRPIDPFERVVVHDGRTWCVLEAASA